MDIYVLVVKQPPTKEKGCKACQFEYDYECYLTSEPLRHDMVVPDWCPLQKVEVKGE